MLSGRYRRSLPIQEAAVVIGCQRRAMKQSEYWILIPECSGKYGRPKAARTRHLMDGHASRVTGAGFRYCDAVGPIVNSFLTSFTPLVCSATCCAVAAVCAEGTVPLSVTTPATVLTWMSASFVT